MHTNFLAGKGCYDHAMDFYAHHFESAETGGLSDLADRVAALYKDFMAGSNSPPKTVSAAKDELAARNRRKCNVSVTQPQQSTGSLNFAVTNQKADALPDRQREALLCDLCYNCIKSRQWDHAIATLTRIAILPNPLNGPSYLREMARRICIGAGHFGVLSERNTTDLKSMLARLQNGEGGGSM
jgi:hypothetical protein